MHFYDFHIQPLNQLLAKCLQWIIQTLGIRRTRQVITVIELLDF